MDQTEDRAPGGRRALVADDEPHIRRILSTLLASAGFAVDVVSDGARALDLLRGDNAYALVITDIMMPGRSGLDVLEELRTLPTRKNTPVIILTAKGQDADRDRAFALGADDFITKPFSPKKLLGRIREILGD